MLSYDVCIAAIDAFQARADRLTDAMMLRAREASADRATYDCAEAAALARRAMVPQLLAEAYAARMVARVRIGVA